MAIGVPEPARRADDSVLKGLLERLDQLRDELDDTYDENGRKARAILAEIKLTCQMIDGLQRDRS